MSQRVRIADLLLRLAFPALVIAYGVGFYLSIEGRSTIVAGYPRAILLGLAALLALAVAMELRDAVRGDDPLVRSLDLSRLPSGWWRAPVVFAALVALILLADVVGFFTTSAVFVLGIMLLLGLRRPVPLLLITAGFIGASYYLFSTFFRLRLPEGFLP